MFLALLFLCHHQAQLHEEKPVFDAPEPELPGIDKCTLFLPGLHQGPRGT